MKAQRGREGSTASKAAASASSTAALPPLAAPCDCQPQKRVPTKDSSSQASAMMLPTYARTSERARQSIDRGPRARHALQSLPTPTTRLRHRHYACTGRS